MRDSETPGTTSSEQAARRLRRLKLLGVLLIVLGVAVDLGTKAWMEDLLVMDPERHGGQKRIELVEGFLALEGSYNPGVTFGLAPGKTVPILVFTILATLLLLVWLLANRSQSIPLHAGLGLVLSGALGNLWDRVHWTKVRDFILFYWGEPGAESFKWPNFNAADSFIVVGVALILWDELFGRRRRERRLAAAAGQA